jgi:16S rRNA processing protein RimM
MERRSKADSRQNSNVGDYTFPVGTVVGFQALAGEVKVKPSTNSPELLTDLSSVRIEFAQGMRPLNSDEPLPQVLDVISSRLDRKMLVLKFEGYKDRTSVEHFEGAQLFAREEELLPLEEEEFWVRDLVGVQAFTTDGVPVGEIVSIIPGGTDILEIKPIGATDGKTILVPFVKDLVPVVDMKARRVEIKALPGLLEPQ